jgi:hypothetical protein
MLSKASGTFPLTHPHCCMKVDVSASFAANGYAHVPAQDFVSFHPD